MHDVNDIYFNRVIINQCAGEEKGKQPPHNTKKHEHKYKKFFFGCQFLKWIFFSASCLRNFSLVEFFGDFVLF
jgi:hypothetical protein